MKEVKKAIQAAVKDLFNVEVEPELTRPAEQFGDYATNIALQLGKQLSKNPREVAEDLAKELSDTKFSKVEVAGPGFINISLSDNALLELSEVKPAQDQKGKTVIVEYSDPNPFKELHVGHLYDSMLGEAIAILCETTGAQVQRVNFGGDVGLHVAKAMWGIIQKLGGENAEKLDEVPKEKRANWLSGCYVAGSRVYDDDESAKKEIIDINRKIYKIHEDKDKSSNLAKIYWACRQWSYDYFDEFYSVIGTEFTKYYPESTTVQIGLNAVQEQLETGVFKKSEGAVVFDGEVHSLHTRVFINSNGLPTYETKDIGLALQKWEDYRFDKNIILTGNDIIEYMKVVLAALKQFAPEVAERTTHLTHGMVKLSGGKKMSSRQGNVIKAVDVIEMTQAVAKNKDLAVDAIKYAFLKQRYLTDIIFDPKESVSIEGNSGPYLQYSHARARSILSKGEAPSKTTDNFEPDERSLLRKISEYPEVVDIAIGELMPHYICTYLYELAQNFNRFYEKNRVIDDPRESVRLLLVQMYADTLQNGLALLNIKAPDKM